ncbi:hypothetical protein [Maribacter sp. MAR_2009_72]|uniref:hypothetical protein n=1 Tax=Maribacter sp. MAR_2009_72 TaxID=1250050 RepID=UPI0011A1C041|nr:hypothetical protein [Maribacter sp. MAR_2009_72]
MKKLDFDFIPLGISIILILVSLVVIATSNYALSLKNYIGIGCVVLSIYFYIKNRMTYYVLYGLTLLIGIFGLLDFYYSTFKVGFGSFGINPILAGLLILHIALVYQIVDKFDRDK